MSVCENMSDPIFSTIKAQSVVLPNAAATGGIIILKDMYALHSLVESCKQPVFEDSVSYVVILSTGIIAILAKPEIENQNKD